MGCPPKKPPLAATEEAREAIVLSVSLASGQFESSLRVNLPATQQEFDAAITSWFKLVLAGFEAGTSQMRATLTRPED